MFLCLLLTETKDTETVQNRCVSLNVVLQANRNRSKTKNKALLEQVFKFIIH